MASGGTTTLYFTGDGDVTPALLTGFTPATTTAIASLPKSWMPLAVTVGGMEAFVQYYGISPGLVGGSQVNFTVPAGVAKGVQPLVLRWGDTRARGEFDGAVSGGGCDSVSCEPAGYFFANFRTRLDISAS